MPYAEPFDDGKSRTQSADTKPTEPIFKVMVTFEQVGFHCWPQAPQEVAYLRNDHRHLFKFKVELQVEHSDRALEIHQLKKVCQRWSELSLLSTVTWSCEKLAQLLLTHLHRCFQPLWGRVECWEDGECGGSCEMSWRGDGTDNC